MPKLNHHDVEGYLAFDESECRSLGKTMAADFKNASPFPSIVIDDFLSADLLRQVHAGYPSNAERDYFNNNQERLKYQYHPEESRSSVVRNLLVYLNDEWLPEYAGDLELWDTRMNACEVRVSPIIGRAVIFATELDSYHGQPDPVECPADRSRRSIATYYYTAIADGYNSVPHRTTNFKARPGTADVPVANPQRDHPLKDWVPPKVYRYAKRFAGRR